MSNLTKKQERDYIEFPVRCPNCNSSNIDTISKVELDDNYAWQDIVCRECGSTWTDTYTLTGITDYEKGNK